MSRKNSPSAASALRIEYLPLDQLARWPGNPKEHAESAIAASISRFGFRDPLAIDEASGRLIAGHGRLSVLERAHAAGHPAPQFVQVREDGMWLVPVTRGASFGSEDEAAAYLVAHNRTGELGGWNDELLGSLLANLDEDLRAVSGFDLAAFVRETDAAATTAPALPEAPSEFLNDLIQPVQPVAAPVLPQQSGSAPGMTVPETSAEVPAPVSAPDTFVTPATGTAPSEGLPAPAAPATDDDPYVQVAYVVRQSERDDLLRAIKDARERFGVATSPEAVVRIVRHYLAGVQQGTVAA
ncbi:hypothetical protein Dcar01_02365 [Deinococcus carri]|uniref:ParB/Sulfiredoxin domain-containing protein n=1 Tax=Deinococcus carri TaxID=1211323 RepID=A0ABP9W9D1_9DEIO